MKPRIFTYFLLFIGIFSHGAAQTFSLSVNNGYGTGNYAAGDTVHIWSKAIAADSVFEEWTGDTTFLEMSREWHTWLVMPAQNIQVNAVFQHYGFGLPQLEQIQCADTIKDVYSYFPPNPRAVVILFHGRDGDADNWVLIRENLQMVKDLIADSFAVLWTEAEDVTKNRDLNGDGKINWNYEALHPDSIDFKNISVLLDTFTNRGLITPSMGKFTLGMSNGGMMSASTSFLLNFDAGVSYCAAGDTAALSDPSRPPFRWCMASEDTNPGVGPQGNANAQTFHQYLLNAGVCTTFLMKMPSPLYPERFMRDPDIDATETNNIYNALVNNGHVDGNGFMNVNWNTLVPIMQGNPGPYAAIAILSTSDQLFVGNQIDVMYADHQFYSDFNHSTIDWLKNLCSGPNSVPEQAAQSPATKLFPNPASGWLNINSLSDWAHGSLADMTGRQRLDFGPCKTLDISGLPSGIYFISLSAADGLLLYSGKVIIN